MLRRSPALKSHEEDRAAAQAAVYAHDLPAKQNSIVAVQTAGQLLLVLHHGAMLHDCQVRLTQLRVSLTSTVPAEGTLCK